MRNWGKSSWLFIAPCKGTQIVESGVESGFGIGSAALEIRKPIKDLMEFSTWNPGSRALFTSMADDFEQSLRLQRNTFCQLVSVELSSSAAGSCKVT